MSASSPLAETCAWGWPSSIDRKSTRLNSSHSQISYAVFCLKKKKKKQTRRLTATSKNRREAFKPELRSGSKQQPRDRRATVPERVHGSATAVVIARSALSA